MKKTTFTSVAGSRVRRRLAGVAASAGLVAGLAGCGAPASSSTANLDYWLWDSAQLPGYQKCVDAFEEQHPAINVRITQYGWGDYWSKLTASFVAEAGPDVFTNHVSKYPEFVRREVLLPLKTLEATKDFDAGEFQDGLAQLWQGPDGKQYGMPKDFDTIALFYNKEMLRKAGMTPEDLEGLKWNPRNGGSFGDVIAHLTIDQNGVRGDEPGFNPNKVKVYGLASGGSGGYNGQTQWSFLAGSTGWRFNDQKTWGTEYNYDDPRFQKTIEWYFGLVEKGYFPPFEKVGATPSASQQLASGNAAIAADGSWMIRIYAAMEGIDMGIAKIPSGPVGHPVSMFNGLADSISAQTEHPEEAAKLVSFLGSDECQVIIGKEGVVFPARPAGTKAAIETFKAQGIDPSPFTELVENEHTMLFPVTDHGATIASIMQPVMDEIYIGTRDPSTLTKVNKRINSLFE